MTPLRALTLAILVSMSSLMLAQEPPAAPATPASSEETLKANLEKKLSSAFVSKSPWITDLGQAKAKSKELGKPIFAYFTRSNLPSPPCHAAEGGPLVSEAFIAFAKDKPLFLHITTQIAGRQGDDLAKTYGFTMFPTFCVLDAEGKLLMTHSGPRTAEALAATYETALSLSGLKAKADAGDAAAKLELEIMADVQNMGKVRDPKAHAALAAKFAKLFEEGKEPTLKTSRMPFFSMALNHAMSLKNADLAEKIVAKLEMVSKESGNPAMAKGIEMWKANIKKMREGTAAPAPEAPTPPTPPSK